MTRPDRDRWSDLWQHFPDDFPEGMLFEEWNIGCRGARRFCTRALGQLKALSKEVCGARCSSVLIAREGP